MQQVFMLTNGTCFEWNGAFYQLIECTDDYRATVRNKQTGHTENFNGCAWVKPLSDVKLVGIE